MYEQEFIDIECVELLNYAQKMKSEGYRLATMHVTRLEQFAYVYSFDKDKKLVNLRFSADYDHPIPSISHSFVYAYLYENEMKDLFGVNVTNINLDFKGHLYKTAIKTPFSTDTSKGKEVKSK